VLHCLAVAFLLVEKAPPSSAAMAKRIELWPVERLRPYGKNARTHSAEQVQQLAASIHQFGFTNPILVDGDGGVIAGHGRLMAAKDLGLAEVPVVVLDHMTTDQKRAYILADNKLALNAGWDEELLQQELAAISLTDFDISILGWTENELASILDPSETDIAEPEDDEEEPEDRGMALAIVLGPSEMLQWRKAKAVIGRASDKGALMKLAADTLEAQE